MKRIFHAVFLGLLLVTAAAAQVGLPRRVIAGPTKPTTCTGGPASGTGAADVWIDTTTASAPAMYVCASSPANTWVAVASAGSGITSINSDTTAAQTIVTGTAGTDFAVATAAGVTTLKLPTASATNRGALASADFTTFNNKPSINATTNTLPKRTSATAFGNSAVSDDGTTVTSTEPVAIPDGSNVAPGLNLHGGGLYYAASKGHVFTTASSDIFAIVASTQMNVLPLVNYCWVATDLTSAQDTCLSRSAAGVIRAGTTLNSSAGQFVGLRFKASGETAQTSGNLALSGWGTGAAVGTISGGDQSVTFTVTAGSSPSANPTVTVTFADGTWTTSPGCQTVQTGGNDIVADVTQTLSATAPVLTWNGTPTNTKTYILTMNCGGR